MKCGWCITEDCGQCRPIIEYEGRTFQCACDHSERPPITQNEWLGYGKYDVYVEGTPD